MPGARQADARGGAAQSASGDGPDLDNLAKDREQLVQNHPELDTLKMLIGFRAR
jgi:hypothetical protein